jgi:hypothetical protein
MPEPKKNKKFYWIEATRVWLADCAKAEPKKVSVLPRFHLKTTFFRQKKFQNFDDFRQTLFWCHFASSSLTLRPNKLECLILQIFFLFCGLH